jgi:hypothetical protein
LNVQQIRIKQTTGKNMFKDTNDFFEKVYQGNVADIDVLNYIFIITEHDCYRLRLLQRDLEFFIFLQIDLLESAITPNDWQKQIEKYHKRGEAIPIITDINHIAVALNKKNKNNVLNENTTYYDTEKVFYTHDLFTIRKLENYINSLIAKHTIIQDTTSKHENIFSNNGFILFEYLLNNHIRPKGITGRFADISDYYWKMYDSDTQYIHQRPARFKEWFFTTYDKEDIGKIKTADNLKDIDRDKHYSNSLDWFKTQN